ncbi:hypothetical protein [Streptomyces rubrogriseus]|uniref:ATP-dependent DNA ligase family profile domain-containing protein n=1 Tax=Streptomyces rubrogriseus TaxID=194673 RepID=A0A6G3TRW2_9ACTN|nr:hypothetical protein [Streptomyces rubrogriseus]NEC39266.1 hypothetical protein [Streptomyces rubrogriseus]
MVVHIDGELVVREGARLAFERLQQRIARRRGAGALAAARTWPAYLVVFDVLSLEGANLTPVALRPARTAPETLFADTPLTAPFTLRPSTTDPATGTRDIHEALLGLATCLITHRHVQRLCEESERDGGA